MLPSVILVSTASSFRGGEYQARLMAGGLASQGYPVVVAASDKSPILQTSDERIGCVTFPHSFGLDLRGCAVLLREIRRNGSPVLVCNDSKALTLGAVVSALVKVPLIAIRRVYFPFAKSKLSRWKYRRCSCVVAISRAIAALCAETLPGIRVKMIPSATRPIEGPYGRAEIRTRLGIADDATVCFSVADFTNPGKRIELLLATAGQLHRRYSSIRLLLVGRMPARLRHGLPDWCLAVGHTAHPYQYYAASDLYLCTSIHEGLGTAILDAVVRDIPAVAPSNGGAPDLFPDDAWLADGVDGRSFFSRLCEIVDNLGAARRRAEVYGRLARDKFSVDRLIDSYGSLLREVRMAARRETVTATAGQSGAHVGA